MTTNPEPRFVPSARGTAPAWTLVHGDVTLVLTAPRSAGYPSAGSKPRQVWTAVAHLAGGVVETGVFARGEFMRDVITLFDDYAGVVALFEDEVYASLVDG